MPSPSTGTSRRFEPRYLITSVRTVAAGNTTNVAKVQAVSDNHGVVVRIEMAGLDPAHDVTLELRDDALDINVQHVEGNSCEQVSHRVALPHAVDQDDVEHTYTDGVLEIRVAL